MNQPMGKQKGLDSSEAKRYLGAALFLGLLLIIMTIICYIPSLHYPFEFDDLSNIVRCFELRCASWKSLLFSSPRWISRLLNSCYYALLPEIQKYDPYFYRLGNIIIHCIAGVSFFLACLLLSGNSRRHHWLRQHGLLVAYLSAGIFLLHPVETQTVSYVIQGQLEAVAGMIIMLMVVMLGAYVHTQHRYVRLLCVLGLWLLALLGTGSKEIFIVAPVLMVLVDWFFIAEGDQRMLISRWWLYALIGITVLTAYLYYLQPSYFMRVLKGNIEVVSNVGNTLTEGRLDLITPWAFFISQFKVIVHYFWIFLWPWNMSVDYDWKLSKHICAPDSIIPLLLLCVVAYIVIQRLRRNPIDLVSFCAVWFFVTVLPRSSIIPSTELLVDYKTYTAAFGVCLFLGLIGSYGLLRLMQHSWWRGGMRSVYVVSTIVLLCIGYGAYRRNLVWRSAADFWMDIILHAPTKARAYNNYGVALCEGGNFKEAVVYFQRAIALDNMYADPYTNLSVAYGALGQFDNAVAVMRHAIRIMPTQPEAYNNLASTLISMSKDDAAEELLKTAIQLRPHYGKAYYNLGRWYLLRHRDGEAYEAFKAACTQADLDNEMGFAAIGNVCGLLGKWDEAVTYYTHALAFNPHSQKYQICRAYAAGMACRYTESEAWYKRIVQDTPQNHAAWVQYGDMLERQGKYAQALKCYDQVHVGKVIPLEVLSKIALCAHKLGDRNTSYAAATRCLSCPEIKPEMKQALEKLMGSME